MNPTNDTYKTLNSAYEFFNKELFGGTLPFCLITMQRKGKARGYFCPERFESRNAEGVLVHEIAMNPSLFKDRDDRDILSTLLHEMIHLWQEENGEAPRRNYHNKQWARKMEELGLIPSNTGEPGGRKTGQSMSHYINDSGKYASIIKEFLNKNEKIQYQDKPEIVIKRAKKKNKIKYSCQKCGINAWGKPGVKLMCGNDKVDLVSEESEEDEV